MAEYLIEGKLIKGVGVNGNCISFAQRTPEERRELGKKGALSNNKRLAKKKKNKRIAEQLSDILIRILTTKVKLPGLKKMLNSLGLDPEDDNYYSAMIAAAILRDCKHGNTNNVIRLIELMDKIEQKDDESKDKMEQLRQLIESVKDV